MHRIIKYIALICLLVCVFTCIGCEKKPEPQPILKVITGTQVGLTIFSKNQYYIVYDNGKTKKVSAFKSTDTIAYAFNPDAEKKNEPYLYLTNNSTAEEIEFNNIAKNIVSLISESKNLSYPSALYIINEKFYFTTSLLKNNYEKNAIFEYNKSNDILKEIVTFKDDITHVEAYQ